MTNDTPIVQKWHSANLAEFSAASNGSRNNTLNTMALKSFSWALGDNNLSVSKVEADYMSAAKALGMLDNEVKPTLRSALSAATPRAIEPTGGNTPNGSVKSPKTNLALAPIYTALEDYAQAHGTPLKAFEEAKWREGIYPYGKYKGAACFIVPHEDGIERARIKNPEETDGKKWLPIKPQGMKDKITPCWYGFKRAVSMAAASKDKTIVLCNGQPSVKSAQYHKIPALAQTDGENKNITTPLMRRLETAIKKHELKVLLVYDGDGTGRDATTLIQKQLLANNITARIVRFGGDDGYDLADYCKQHKTGVMAKLLRLASYSDKLSQPVLSRSEIAERVHNIVVLTQDYIPSGELLVMPFKAFHKLGGYAHILEPGKLTKILSPSGGGKTSFLETCNDHWNMLGIDTMWFSPEWSALSIQYRAIQRYSGISTNVIREHILWETEAARGIAEAQRMGKPLLKNSPQYQKYLETNLELSKWPGQAYIFQGQRVTGEILEDMSKQLHLLRRDGRRVGIAFFDYAQLLHTVVEEKGRNSYEIICDMIKTWCGDNDIHAMVGSQPTKAVGDAAIQNGKVLTKYDSHWVQPNAFNLIITLNIKYSKIGGELIKTDYAIANVAKNSEGQEGPVRLRTNFKYLSWIAETRRNPI